MSRRLATPANFAIVPKQSRIEGSARSIFLPAQESRRPAGKTFRVRTDSCLRASDAGDALDSNRQGPHPKQPEKRRRGYPEADGQRVLMLRMQSSKCDYV